MNKTLAIIGNIILYLFLIVLIYSFWKGLGLTIIAAIVYFPLLFYHYILYLNLNFWKRFYKRKSKNLFYMVQAIIYLIFYLILIIFFKDLFYYTFKFSQIFNYLGWILLIIFVSSLAIITQKFSVKRMSYFNTIFREETRKSMSFISTGFYKYTRNPMYIVDIIILISIFLISKTYFSGILALLYIINVPFFIKLEEKELRKTFGKSYLEYYKRTPRFIPKF